MAIFKTIKDILAKTRTVFSHNFDFLRGKTVLDAETLEHLENTLLRADFGIKVTETILNRVKKRVDKLEADALSILKAELKNLIIEHQRPFVFQKSAQPKLILMVGVNGAGKTTSLGKLAYYFKEQGLNLILAAGDTFRAAAVEQLIELARRSNVPIISQTEGADSASVIFDALQSGISKKVDLVLADTAGRLQNKQHLMEELKKIVRVMKKLDRDAPHEVILVLDASTGQNALLQAKEFNASIPLTGLILTKLDGTAKGGVVFSLSAEYKLPIYFLGTGEDLIDLSPFNVEEFIDSLF